MMKMDYTKRVEKEASIQAEVRVVPKAEVGEVRFDFISNPKPEPCEGTEGTPSTGKDFIISQMICLKIPVHFSTEAVVVSTGFDCQQQSVDHESHLSDNHEPLRGDDHKPLPGDDHEPDPGDDHELNLGDNHEPHSGDDVQDLERFMTWERYQISEPTRQFTRNYQLTYQNSPEPRTYIMMGRSRNNAMFS